MIFNLIFGAYPLTPFLRLKKSFVKFKKKFIKFLWLLQDATRKKFKQKNAVLISPALSALPARFFGAQLGIETGMVMQEAY